MSTPIVSAAAALAAAGLSALAAPVALAIPVSAEATDNSTVQLAGPRTGGQGDNFFNIQGENNGARFAEALAVCTLCVARSGGSIFEIAAAGRPAVLVPYPHAAADHQTTNARFMADAGAAVVVPDDELSPARLRGEVDALLAGPGRLAAMARASAALARPAAAQDIAGEVLAAARAARR